jgi:hypothetical protein
MVAIAFTSQHSVDDAGLIAIINSSGGGGGGLLSYNMPITYSISAPIFEISWWKDTI